MKRQTLPINELKTSTTPPCKQGSGDYEVGHKRPPKNRQFGQPNGNPQRRGLWKIEDTARFKLESMMKLDEHSLREVYANKNAPLFERKLAKAIHEGDWKVIREMIHEVYGTPKQQVELDTKEITVTIRDYAGGNHPSAQATPSD